LFQRASCGPGIDRPAGDCDPVEKGRDVVGRDQDRGGVEQHDVTARSALTVED
jgi:hypothetical protein